MKNNQTKSVKNHLDRPFLCLANIYWDTQMIIKISNKLKNIYLLYTPFYQVNKLHKRPTINATNSIHID